MSDYGTPHLTDRQWSLVQRSALERIAKAREAGPYAKAVEHVEQTATAFFDGVHDLEATEARILADRNLSDEGRREQRRAATEAWERESAEQLEELAEDVDRAVRFDPEKLKPRPPLDDPAANEARLANARADARMLLDGEDLTILPLRMKALVEHGDDPAIAHLLVGEWSMNYIRSRLPKNAPADRHGTLVEWSGIRQNLVRSQLDAAGQAEYDRAAALKPLTQVVDIARHVREAALRERRGRG